MIKSTRNGYCDHVQDIRNLSTRVENIQWRVWEGSWAAVWEGSCSLGGERWDEKEEEGETKEESVGRWVHIMVFSDGISATSLYGYLSLNPSVIFVGKIVQRHHAVAYFQTSCIPRRTYSVGIYRQILRRNYFRRYILPTEKFRR